MNEKAAIIYLDVLVGCEVTVLDKNNNVHTGIMYRNTQKELYYGIRDSIIIYPRDVHRIDVRDRVIRLKLV